jgi:hypothetical protein
LRRSKRSTNEVVIPYEEEEEDEEGITVNKHHYKEVNPSLSKQFNSYKRPELWHRMNWLLQHDNTPAHCSVLVQEELAKQQVTICHTLHAHLVSCHVIYFSSLSFPT